MKVGIVFTESPYGDEVHASNLALADVVWCNERTSVDRLQYAFRMMDSEALCRYLPTAWNPQVHSPSDPDPTIPTHDVVFVGSGFAERITALEAVDWSGIDLGLYGQWALLAPRYLHKLTEHLPVAVLRWVMRGVPGGRSLWRHVRGGIIANEYAAGLYRRAKIALNLDRDSVEYTRRPVTVTHSQSMGPRMYELAATGTFTISAYREEIAEVFGDLVPTFRSPDELGPLLRDWLRRPADRAAIERALPGAVEKHSYRHRADRLVSDLERIG